MKMMPLCFTCHFAVITWRQHCLQHSNARDVRDSMQLCFISLLC